MERDDQTYYYERAQTELKLAQASELPQAVQAHYTIATRYLDRAYDGDDTIAGHAVVENRAGKQVQPGEAQGSDRKSSANDCRRLGGSRDPGVG